MPMRQYEWNRFWIPRGDVFSLDHKGFLPDPNEGLNVYLNPRVLEFEKITHMPCLVLLGEPGIGKSIAMVSAYEALKQAGHKALSVNLREYGSESRLINALFNSAEFVEWRQGVDQLNLFIDSLDEGLLQVSNICALLAAELRQYPLKRLALRIACRTADWPAHFEDELRGLFGEKGVGAYELAPLREIDVRLAGDVWEVNVDGFLLEVERIGVAPFANRPLTLEFLLRMFKKNGSLPSTQPEIFIEGARLLCEETSERWTRLNRPDALSAEQKLLVASRIAACTILANKSSVWIGIEQGDVPPDDVTIREILGGHEEVAKIRFPVSENAVSETLGTGLFSARGPQRLGWAHQTYGEFLAAWYLIRRNLPDKEIMNLITHPSSEGASLIPQLHEMAAWLTCLRPRLLKHVVEKSPEAMLTSKITSTTHKEREVLVQGLLYQLERGRLQHLTMSLHSHYEHLAHRNLPQQLRPYILSKGRKTHVRREAIMIASATDETGLEDELVTVALDSTDSFGVRLSASYAVANIGSETAKARLRPLVFGEAGSDPDDELKGCGLAATWPNHVTSKELFACLTPPRSGLIGAYKMFLSSQLPSRLPTDCLPEALRWVEGMPHRLRTGYDFDHLIDTIMIAGWEKLDEPGILEPYARAMTSRIKLHDNIGTASEEQTFREKMFAEPEKRHKLVSLMVPLIEELGLKPIIAAYGSIPIVTWRDTAWLLEQYQNEDVESLQAVWGELVERAFDGQVPGQMDLVLKTCLEDERLKDRFKWAIGPIKLDSEEAKRFREFHKERQDFELKREKAQQVRVLHPPPRERVQEVLGKCESGDIQAFWQLTNELTLSPNSRTWGDVFSADLTKVPGWEKADELTRGRIAEAARKYILECECSPEEWLEETNKYYFPAGAGYKALRLLLQRDPGFIEELSSDVWRAWAPVVLAHLDGWSEDEHALQKKLVQHAYQKAPEEVISTLNVLIDQENAAKSGSLFVLRKLDECWDDRMLETLLNKVKVDTLKPVGIGEILSVLIQHGSEDARNYAESLVGPPIVPEGMGREKAIEAAAILFTATSDGAWSVMWPAIVSDTDFGRKVLERVAHDEYQYYSVGQKLAEEEVATLYLWLATEYPREDDPRRTGGAVGTRHMISDFRDYLLRALVGRGTFQACDQLRHIAEERPQDTWMTYHIDQAQESARRGTWTPLSPVEIIELVGRDHFALRKLISLKLKLGWLEINAGMLWQKIVTTWQKYFRKKAK